MTPRPRRLLPHEVVFGAFLLVTWARFTVVLGPASPEALTYLALLAADAALIAWCRARPSDRRWRVRLAFHPLALNVVFLQMKTAIPKLVPESRDRLLQALDRRLVGGDASVRLEAFARPWLTEALSLCYLLFFPYLALALITAFRGPLATLKALLAGVFTIYGVGFLGYSFVPAAGPYVALAREYEGALAGGPVTRWNSAVVALGSNGVDVFPSLHCALTAFLLFFDRRHAPRRWRLALVPVVGLWFSTVYLRYHYVVDLVAGFALAGLALAVSARFERRAEAEGAG